VQVTREKHLSRRGDTKGVKKRRLSKCDGRNQLQKFVSGAINSNKPDTSREERAIKSEKAQREVEGGRHELIILGASAKFSWASFERGLTSLRQSFDRGERRGLECNLEGWDRQVIKAK